MGACTEGTEGTGTAMMTIEDIRGIAMLFIPNVY